MLFWTKEEYLKFSEVMKDKPVSYYAFEVLYWTGIREGELLALERGDFNISDRKLTINKSYQHLQGEDYITSPKTEESNRVIELPEFLCQEMEDYFGMLYKCDEHTRLFTFSKNYLHHEMDRGAKAAGVKRIRIHDLRHSHVAHCIELGFSPVAIAERLGHEGINITFNYAHQKKVEIPAEKLVLYERCQNCNRKAYQQAKEWYEYQRNGLEKQYMAKGVGFDTMLIVLWWYAIVTTIFAAMRSDIFLLDDFTAIFDALWNGIRQSCKWIVGVAKALAQVGDRIPNETIAIMVHWLLFIIVIVGVIAVVGILIVIIEKKVTKLYRENCWEVISVGVTVTSLALAVYFGDWIKALVRLNLVALLLLVQAVYVGIRVYVRGCKRARGYY